MFEGIEEKECLEGGTNPPKSSNFHAKILFSLQVETFSSSEEAQRELSTIKSFTSFSFGGNGSTASPVAIFGHHLRGLVLCLSLFSTHPD